MISPTLWMIVEYILAAPFGAALRACLLGRDSGKLKKSQIWTACILGFGLGLSAINGLDGVLNMFPLMIPIFCVTLWCSAHFAMDCVKKKEADELNAWDIAWAMVCYFGFLILVIFKAPSLRWCEGCMEWH